MFIKYDKQWIYDRINMRGMFDDIKFNVIDILSIIIKTLYTTTLGLKYYDNDSMAVLVIKCY